MDDLIAALTIYVQGESIGTFPSPRAAQAACDARLEAAGVRLCGEVVRE